LLTDIKTLCEPCKHFQCRDYSRGKSAILDFFGYGCMVKKLPLSEMIPEQCGEENCELFEKRKATSLF
jgi:hypothetical protein